MVIFGSILAFLGAAVPVFLSCASYGFLGMAHLTLYLIIILSILSLFLKRSPCLGVFITLLSLYEITKTGWDRVTALLLCLSIVGGIMIILKAHDNWMDKKNKEARARLGRA